MSTHEPLPFGIDDVDPRLQWNDQNEGELRCVVRGCTNFARPASEVCPVHGIRSHSSGTYSYEDPRQNAIIDRELFDQHVVQSKIKQDCDRLGHENSEDTLTWNVFRSLQRAGLLAKIASLLLGIQQDGEPEIYFWGMNGSDDSFTLWSLLRNARARFEKDLRLPSKNTEPDIALHLPGKYLLLIEAKFTSQNSVLPPNRSKQKRIIKIYNDTSTTALDLVRARACDTFCDQLWRNMVFAEWMARSDSENTQPYLINLVRKGAEVTGSTAFKSLLTDEKSQYFRTATWEQIYAAIPAESQILSLLRNYMEKKTAKLRKAFQL